ncbi:MAG: bifunctional DNA-formamidopyrimidine glycosylase/DNA-(apurinic or apyrimidinic site) lyase [Gammaproteobacteria bacterium]
MPELPEVETTRRCIRPYVVGRRVEQVIVRQRALRWPVTKRLQREFRGQCINSVDRRGKYLLFRTPAGTAILHLGMSGSLRIVAATQRAGKHDHVDIVLEGGKSLRLRDPRRFGSLHWTRREPLRHPLLAKLGPEPLLEEFNGDYLYEHSRSRKVAIKQYLMDGHTVAGFGNIYANESLFLAGIHPQHAAGRISRQRYDRLAKVMKQVLEESLAKGGTTLQDFINGDGNPGYFKQYLRVYGRAGQPCPACHAPVRQRQQGQRATFFCPRCQH